MDVKLGKLVVGSSLALSLSAFALPVFAYTSAHVLDISTQGYLGEENGRPPTVQYAEEEHHDVVNQAESAVDRKSDEVRDEAHDAKAAVENRHEMNEATESEHHAANLEDKAERKAGEMRDEAHEATDAVKQEHEAHESMDR